MHKIKKKNTKKITVRTAFKKISSVLINTYLLITKYIVYFISGNTIVIKKYPHA